MTRPSSNSPRRPSATLSTLSRTDSTGAPGCWRATCRSCRTGCRPYLSEWCINIHHLFLPGFEGTKSEAEHRGRRAGRRSWLERPAAPRSWMRRSPPWSGLRRRSTGSRSNGGRFAADAEVDRGCWSPPFVPILLAPVGADLPLRTDFVEIARAYGRGHPDADGRRGGGRRLRRRQGVGKMPAIPPRAAVQGQRPAFAATGPTRWRRADIQPSVASVSPEGLYSAPTGAE